MKHLLYLVTFLFIGINFATAQQGIIKGTLKDEKTQEPIMFANVAIKQAESVITGAQTDYDGNYTANVTAGTYTIEFTYLGYQTLVINDVTVNAEEEIVLTTAMKEEGLELDINVVVSAKANRQNANVLLLERKKSGLILETIGAKQLQASGAADVADGLKKVPGLSIQGSKFLVVRGLSERYNNSTLNGFPVASPNPDKRVLPYDIFPTSVIENLSVSKSFNPDFYANFSGASVDIVTRDYPNERTITFGITGSMNTQSTFQEFKIDGEKSNDILGYNTTREIPSVIQDFYAENNGRFASNGKQITEANFFNTKFDPEVVTAPINQSYSFSYGDRIIVDSANRTELGVQFNVNYGNSYNNDFGQIRLINAQGTTLRDFDYNNDVYSTNLSSIANVTLKFNKDNFISFKNLYTHLSDNSIIETAGYYNDFDPDSSYVRRSTYKDYALRTNQLIGKHTIGNSVIDWGASYSKADAAEPDRRQVAFFYDGNSNDSEEFRFDRINSAETHRFFTDMNDNDLSVKGQYKYVFTTGDGEFNPNQNFITGGINSRYKIRDFGLRKYNYDLGDLGTSSSRYDIYGVDDILTIDALAANDYKITEDFQPQNNYNANLLIVAPYTFGNFTTGKFGITAGVRFEYANQIIEYSDGNDDLENTIEGIDYFPSFIAKYDVTAASSLRLSATRTVSRPDFRELAPFEYQENFGAFRTKGNPELQNGFNNNVDLRYEFIPSSNTRAGELIAVTAFYKYLDQPIIPTIELGSNPVKSYANAIDGYAIGLELEFRKSLGFIAAAFDDLYFNFNSTLLNTVVNADPTISNQTSSVRPLIGASPYLINADLTYKYTNSAYNTLLISLSYNTFGARLSGLGAVGSGDIYEQPVNTLNATTSYQFGNDNAWGLRLTARNILNATYVTQQEILESGTNTVIDTKILNEFTTGTGISLGLTYRIR